MVVLAKPLTAANRDANIRMRIAVSGYGATLLGSAQSERNFANELAAEKTRKNAEDFVLNEAVNILGDELAVLKTGGGLEARVKPDSTLVPE